MCYSEISFQKSILENFKSPKQLSRNFMLYSFILECCYLGALVTYSKQQCIQYIP